MGQPGTSFYSFTLRAFAFHPTHFVLALHAWLLRVSDTLLSDSDSGA